MADKKISELNSASLPLAGSELVPIVQGGETVKVEVSEISGGGGSAGTLQQVTDNGNTTTNAIEVSNYIKASEFRSSADDITFADGSGNPIFFFASTGSNIANFDKALLTADRNFSLPDASGTIALTSNIPTVDATPTDGSSNAVSSNGVFDGLALKQDVLTETNFGAFMNARTAKNTLVDADEVVSDDSADSNKAKKTTWLNVWTNYLKVKTDALYATISNLALKQDFATDSFASTITFDVPKVYNSFSSPSSSNISQSLTGARIGVVQKFYSNKATEPTYPSGWVKLSGTYTNSVTNIIYAEWCEGSRVEYWIVKA